MGKQEIENRINAIKNIINATVKGEKIKSILQSDMDKEGVSIPDYPKPIGGLSDRNGSYEADTEIYDNDELMNYDDAIMNYEELLSEREDWKQMEEFSAQIQLKICQERCTLEELGNYIQTNIGSAVNIDSIELYDCKETESDLKYEDCLEDEDIIAYFDGKYNFDYEGPWPNDVAQIILEKGISIDEFPEKLLFNLPFVDSYIQGISLARARETEQKGITPQDIEDVSSSVKLGAFREATNQVKENVKGAQEITTEDKNIDDK